MKLVITTLIVFFMVSCGDDGVLRSPLDSTRIEQTNGSDQTTDDDDTTGTNTDPASTPDGSKCGSLEKDECLVVDALYRHCAACHAIGNKRFIYDESYENTFEYITTVNYEENKTWIKAIRDSIDWKNGEIPEYGTERENDKEFMPLGKKRQDMNEESINGEPLQNFMMKVLNKYAR